MSLLNNGSFSDIVDDKQDYIDNIKNNDFSFEGFEENVELEALDKIQFLQDRQYLSDLLNARVKFNNNDSGDWNNFYDSY